MDQRPARSLSDSFGRAIRVKHLGVMLRVHRLSKFLPQLFSQIKEIGRVCKLVTIGIAADRPSADVVIALNRVNWSKKYRVLVQATPKPVVSNEGEAWCESLRFVHQLIVPYGPDAILNLDDDQLFSPNAIREIRGHLSTFVSDRYEFQSLFFWDAPQTYNSSFPEHWSANLFRVYLRDEFSDKFVAQCPEACARSPEVYRMKYPLLNYGYLEASERERIWAGCKLAGRIDAHTLALVRPARLKDYNADFKS